jgi:hypothetical protein
MCEAAGMNPKLRLQVRVLGMPGTSAEDASGNEWSQPKRKAIWSVNSNTIRAKRSSHQDTMCPRCKTWRCWVSHPSLLFSYSSLLDGNVYFESLYHF